MDTRTNADRLDAGLPRGERPDGGRLDSDHSNSERGPLAGLALLAVLAVAFGSAVAVTGVDRLGGFAARLDVGIPVLFVIAGYLLYLPFARALTDGTALPGLHRYARRRLLAIYPAYWVVLFVAAFVYERAAPMTAVDLAKYLTLTHIYWADTLVGPIPSSWALATGVSFCVFAPLFAAVQRRLPNDSEAQRIRNQWLGLAAMVVVALAFRAWLVTRGVAIPGPDVAGAGVSRLTVVKGQTWLLNHLDTFAAGMAIALARVTWERRDVAASGSASGQWMEWSSKQLRRFSISRAGILALIILSAPGAWLYPSGEALSATDEFVRHLVYLLIGAVAVGVVVAGTQGSWWGIRALGSSAMRRAARLTYGILLWHGLVIAVYASRNPDAQFNLSLWRLLIFVTPIVALLSWLLWRLVQRPTWALVHRSVPVFAGGMWLIGGAGLLWRMISILHITTVNPDGGDPFYYHIQAGLLSAGRGFSEPFRWVRDGTLEPTAIHPPLYSMYLSISSFLGADTYLAHKALSILAGTGVVVVIGLIARRMGGNWAGWIAASLAAFYPQFWIVDGILWSEGLFTLFIALTVWAAFAYRDRPSRLGAMWLGLAVSGAVLTRGEALILAPMLVAPLVFFGPRSLRVVRGMLGRGRAVSPDPDTPAAESPAAESPDAEAAEGEVSFPWRERTLRLVIAAAAVTLPIVPWVARNMTAFDQPITISSNSDEVLYYANCVDSYYGDFIGYWSFPCQERERQVVEEPRDEAVRVKFWRDKGIDYAMSHKSRWPVVVAARIGRVLEVYKPAQGARILSIEGRPLGWTQLGQVMWWAMLPLAAVGGWMLRRRGRWAWPLWSQVVMVMAVTVVVYGHVRFRPPMDLAVIVFAAVALSAALRAAAGRALDDPLADRVLGVEDAPGGEWVLDAGQGPTTGEHDTAGWFERPDGEPSGNDAATEADVPPRRRRGAAARWGAGPLRWWRAHPGWRTGIGVAIIVAAVLAPLRELLRRQGVPMEEGFMLAFPQRVLAGDVPNADFLHLYGPGSLWALAAWFKVFGTNLAAERWFGLLQLAGIIGGVAALARAWGRRMMVIAGVTCAVISITAVGLAALAWNGGLALLVGSVLALRWTVAGRPDWDQPTVGASASDTSADGPTNHALRTGPLVLTGALAGAALLVRPDLVLAVALIAGVALWIAGEGRRRLWKAGAALAGVGSLILVQLALAGPGAAIKGMVIQPVFDLRAGRALPVPPSWGSIDGFTQRVGMLVPPSWPLPMPTPSQQVFLWFVGLLAGTLLAVVTAWVVGRRAGWNTAVLRRDRGALTTLLIAPLVLGILPQGVQRADTTHLAWVGCVVIPLVPGLVFQLTRAWVRPRYRGALVSVLGVMVLLALLVIAPIYTVRPYLERVEESLGAPPPAEWSIERDGRNFWLGGAPLTVAAQQLAADLDRMSEPGERLFVGPSDLSKTPYSDAYWYYLFGDLDPATRYIEMDPGIADAPDSGLAEDLATADWVILSHLWDDWDEANTSGEPGSNEPNLVLAEQFCEYRSYGDAFELWRRRPDGGACPAPQPATPVEAPPERG
ncbi:acyltransferase family protein [Candidatus Neomicrothrix sp.]|uniref:acyltransferase family protein n=1 Tax=Candidatus Neomicrothrix sp. TaxID=2719034 RepID=UPI00259AD0B3|nr:acyltransferase family protein [Candidatus Microthrix sp.]HMS47299.1 acyltransferase family protein [Candidatus Microthrix sp.]